MKKKLLIGLILLITVIYCIVGVLLFTNLQILQAPETTITLKVLEFNTDETVILTKVEVNNTNPFELITKDFQVQLLTDSGKEVGRVFLKGGSIPPQKTQSFSAPIHLSLQGESLNSIRTKISGIVGLNIFGILTKTLPLNLVLITDLNNSLEHIQAPTIRAEVDLRDISEQGITIIGTIDVTNPNSFDLSMNPFTSTIKTEKGITVGELTISGGLVSAQQNTKFSGEGWILLESLNANFLTTTIETQASITIAGYEKTLDVKTEAKIMMPNLDDLFTSHKPLDLTILGDYRINRHGVTIDVELGINNPYNLSLIAKDLTVTVYHIKNEEKTKIGYGVIGDGIVPPNSNITLTGQIELPRQRLLASLKDIFFSDWLLTTVRGNLTIKGLEKTFWIGLSGYSDLRPFQ